MDFILEALSIPMFNRALFAGLLVSLACGIIGSYVVTKRISSISGGLSHAAFGGVGLGYLLGFSPLIGALGFCLVCSYIIGVTYFKRRESLDTLISMLWSSGMALGMLFIALTPGYAPDLSAYLFGSIIFVPSQYLLLALLLDVLVVLVAGLYFKRLQAVCFDEEFSEVIGLPVKSIFISLLLLSALTVVMLIRVAGVILTIALLTTPAVIAQHWSNSLAGIMRLSTVIAASSITLGLFLGYWLSNAGIADVPTGPLIILFLSFVYICSTTYRTFISRGSLE